MPKQPILAHRSGACFGTAMRKASRRVTQLYDDALGPCGLRSTQYAIFAELTYRDATPPTLAELAAALVMDRSSVGHNLRPLERDGYVALQAGDTDRRQRRVALTPLGQAKFREAQRLWQTAQDKFVGIYGEAASEQLRTALLSVAYDERLGTYSEGDRA
ncbi:MarR family winged helix-turn-helix transcriptional regulator [Acidisphaera sp. L21]|uniref:MarR family winged helix-turn-helix transcriptional regulator n=1 Tax=Acidisphaera sp. L21 TaxID=1641851 RepID=UPI001C201BA6|nr:MarR family winged helix-turn-helix transcriptional regulator [Acidisphaera sp. L21]